jgi:hypothetical protein
MERDINTIVCQSALSGALRPEQVAGFAIAYSEAKRLAFKAYERRRKSKVHITPTELRRNVRYWAKLIEEENKRYREEDTEKYRFPFGEIPKAMESFYQEFGQMDPDTAMRILHMINPFSDGNTRLRYLVWCLSQTLRRGEWPNEKYPQMFPD